MKKCWLHADVNVWPSLFAWPFFSSLCVGTFLLVFQSSSNISPQVTAVVVVFLVREEEELRTTQFLYTSEQRTRLFAWNIEIGRRTVAGWFAEVDMLHSVLAFAKLQITIKHILLRKNEKHIIFEYTFSVYAIS